MNRDGYTNSIHEGECPRCDYDRVTMMGDSFAGVYSASCNACGLATRYNMTDDIKRVAGDMVGTMTGLPALSDMDDDEAVTRKVNWFDHPRHENTAGWTMGATLGIDTETWTEYVEEHFGPKVDRRKFKTGKTTHVGYLVIRGDGEIVDHEIKPECLKPSEQP
jgi:hypothetical protein